MSAEIQTPETSRRSTMISGAFLIALGALMWVAQNGRFDTGTFFMFALSAIFLAWGLLARAFGLLIPGGLLSGISMGIYLTETAFPNLGEPQKGAVVLLSIAAGWALISLLSPLTGRFHAWPLIPGAILAAIGGALLAGQPGLSALEMVGRTWPLGLIALGLYLILWRSSRKA